MINLVNKEHIFNESMLNNIEFVDYENYREDTLYVEYNTFYHFEMLKAHLKVEDIYIDMIDAYRSLEKQENIFCKYMQIHSINEAEDNISMPGFSEHHTGFAIDFAVKIDDKWIENEELDSYTDILNRIYKSLKYFGFILRYPKNIENLTLEEYIYANN